MPHVQTIPASLPFVLSASTVPSSSFMRVLSEPGTLSSDPGSITVYPLGKMSVVKWSWISARPFTRPERFTAVTSPCT